MKHSFKYSFMLILIVLALMISALGVTPAFADDETPPPPAAEEPAQPPAEEPVQSPVVETAPEVVTTEAPVEATPAPDVVEEAAPAEATPVAEILSEVPESTDVVVLDENNEALPLTSEDAADVVKEADPKWCPEGELPNSAKCSANFPTISDLLADMQSNPGFYSQDGVIYFERVGLTTFTTPFVLDDSSGSLGSAYDMLKPFSITLTGGWSGGTSTSLPGRTVFGGPDAFVQIGTAGNPWAGNVTINNIQIGDTTNGGVSSNNSLTVYTTDGHITLNNVDVTQQAGNYNTAYLQSDSGDIVVGPSLTLAAPGGNSVFDGNNASGVQNKGFSATTSTGTISITDATFQQASQTGTAYSHGATLSAPVINLTNVTARGNDGSGVYVDGTGITIVNVFGGTYTNNKRYGIEVADGILNEQSAPTCSNNLLATADNPCYNVMPNSAPTITVDNVTVEADTLGGWNLAFDTIVSASDVEDGIPSVSCSPASGTLLSLGTVTVSCTATDQGGLTASDSGDVTVVDTTAPSLSVPSDITLAATSPAGAVATFSAFAKDIVYGKISVTCDPASGSTFPLGTTTVDCSATDDSSNTANGSFNVIVKDTGAPILTLPANIHIIASDPSYAVVTYFASAMDMIDGPVPVVCVPPSGSVFPDGTTSVKCSATDSAGNTATGSFNVTVDVDQAGMPPFYNVTQLTQAQLPGVLGQGSSFGSALKLEFTDQAKNNENYSVSLSFPIPANMKGMNLVVLFWDGSAWVEVSGGSVVGNSFVITVFAPGYYVLVSR